MKKIVGKVSVEEKNQIEALFERRNGLEELAKILPNLTKDKERERL